MASPDLYDCVVQLLDNDPDVFENAASTLIMIMKNISSNQEVEKFRRIKISGATVSKNLLPASGAMECLFMSGFVEDADSEYLVLPMTSDLTDLQSICSQIQRHSKKTAGGGDKSNPTTINEAHGTKTTKITPEWPKWKFPSLPSNISTLERQTYQKLRSSFEHVLVYEDLELQEKARQCIPRERLLQSATRKYDSAKGSTTYDLADFYTMELMDWFREDFFRWVSSPDCHSCEGKTQHTGMGTPSQDDMRWGAGRVEIFQCTQCGKMTRFPRYNHPGKLLETRKGRCGEWANCFTLICRASGYEARYVLDWTDHVWTEIFSHSQQRWLHCDPGEKALDKPLRYESGWGKKLTYVIAFSKDDISDVTWRYIANPPEVILRRTECRENWLVLTIKALRDERQKSMSEVVKRIHHLRLLKEGGEFLSSGGGQSRKLSADDMIGRQTGSLEWREARGELGSGRVISPHHVFSPMQSALEENCMTVSYCCANNFYTQSGCAERVHDWQTAVFESENMQRNVEVDWNMVYLARTKHSSNASVSWKFDLSDTGKTMTEVTVNASSETFHSGCVVWSVTDNFGNKHLIQPDTEYRLDSVISGAEAITLSAELSAGDGDDGWQHTQLFRQKRDSKQNALHIVIKFE